MTRVVHWDGLVHRIHSLGRTRCQRHAPDAAVFTEQEPVGMERCERCYLPRTPRIGTDAGRKITREQVDKALRAFKARGGVIQHIENEVSAPLFRVGHWDQISDLEALE